MSIIILFRFEKKYKLPDLQSYDYDKLIEYYNKRQKLEYDMVDPVVKSDLLKGVGSDFFEEIAYRTKFRPHTLEMFYLLHSIGITPHIISVNWSIDTIKLPLQLCNVNDVKISSSNLLFDENHISTGEITRDILSGIDKVREMNKYIIIFIEYWIKIKLVYLFILVIVQLMFYLH